MMDAKPFFQKLDNVVSEFNELEGPFKIVSHLDADGLASAAIIVRALMRAGKKFSVSVLRNVDSNSLDELFREDYANFIFVDLGSNCVKAISEKLKDRTVLILDHHRPDGFKAGNVMHVNPFLFEIDGDRDVSGASVSYFFARSLDEKNKEVAHLAVIGSIGDCQESKGFSGLNDLVLEDAVDAGKIEVREGLRVFGTQTKPIHKVLEYSTDPYIPGVTGNENGVLEFLSEVGVEFKDKNGKYRKMVHLDEDDVKKLVTGIILRRMGSEENPEDVLGNIYLLVDEEDESPTRDAREFSTLLNSCGRLNKPSLGVGVCLGSGKLKKDAAYVLDAYRKEIVSSLNWFYDARKRKEIVEKKGYVIVNAEDNIRDTLVGTLASIISNSNIYGKGKVVVVMANTLEGDIKVSMRVLGNGKIDLREVIDSVLEVVGGWGGGHKSAGGCLVPQEKEKLFLETLQKFLDKYLLEEKV